MEIYNGFSNVNSVIHTHSEYATIFAQAKMPIPCMGTTHADYFYNEIPVVKDLTEDEIKNDFEKNSGRGIVKFFYENKISMLTLSSEKLLDNHELLDPIKEYFIINKMELHNNFVNSALSLLP